MSIPTTIDKNISNSLAAFKQLANGLNTSMCAYDEVYYGGICSRCMGRSNKFDTDGYPVEPDGCFCPRGYGYDIMKEMCITCPRNTSSGPDYSGGPVSDTLLGCNCPNYHYYNSTTKLCEMCPSSSSADKKYKDNTIPNFPQCYCPDGTSWNSTTNNCKRCSDDMSNTGSKAGQCVSCPANSSLFGQGSGNPRVKLDVGGCKCNNGYIYSLFGDRCVACPDGYTSMFNRCCPPGSNMYGNGKKVEDGCYCLAYHTYNNGKCDFNSGDIYYNIITLSSTGTNITPTLQKNLTLPTIPVNITGITNINVCGIYIDIKNPSTFLKNITFNYDKLDGTPGIYTLPNLREIFLDNNNDESYADFVDSQIRIKRISFSIRSSANYDITKDPIFSLILLSKTGVMHQIQIPLNKNGVNYDIVLDINYA